MNIKKLEIVKFCFSVLFLLILFSCAFISHFPLTGNIVDTEGYKIVPLNPEERGTIEQSIMATDFIKDIPTNDPIFLRFFTFENGERVWKDGFLVGEKGILKDGKPSIYLSINAKYIENLNGSDLCSVIQKAVQNKDIGLYSDYSKPRLFFKYASMLKYRGCFGF